jgi:phage protein D
MRDEIVFQSVRNRNIPIFMVTSGGYQVTTTFNTITISLSLSEEQCSSYS